MRRDGARQRCRIGELAAARPIGADKIGVAELADRVGAILFQPAPQIAAGKAQEHRGAAGLRALALQRVEDFLDRVGHAARVLRIARRRAIRRPDTRRSHSPSHAGALRSPS